MTHDENNLEGKEEKRVDDGVPEPPASWRPGSLNGQQPLQPNQQVQLPNQPQQHQKIPQIPPQLYEAQRLVKIAQICAIISLFIGGVILSGISLVIAITAYMRLSAYADSVTTDPLHKKVFTRPGVSVIVIASIALVLNVVTLIAFYPMIEQFLQTNDLSTLFGGTGTGSGSSGTATWG